MPTTIASFKSVFPIGCIYAGINGWSDYWHDVGRRSIFKGGALESGRRSGCILNGRRSGYMRVAENLDIREWQHESGSTRVAVREWQYESGSTSVAYTEYEIDLNVDRGSMTGMMLTDMMTTQNQRGTQSSLAQQTISTLRQLCRPRNT